MFELGIYISTIRPELWEGLYENLATNNIGFEIIFVGPLNDFSLPRNSRFIYSDACPAECWHIGAMACNSKYMMNMPDDARFLDGFALDRLVDNIQTQPTSFIVSPRYKRCKLQTFLPKKRNSPWNPLLPICSLMNKSLYMDLKGVDRRFINLLWDVDFAMRVYERGGEVIVDNSVMVTEIEDDEPKRLTGKSKRDKALLHSLWIKKRRGIWNICHKRSDLVRPYGDF